MGVLGMFEGNHGMRSSSRQISSVGYLRPYAVRVSLCMDLERGKRD